VRGRSLLGAAMTPTLAVIPPWSEQEVAFLREYYGVLDVGRISRFLCRSKWSVRTKAHRLGCASMRKRAAAQ
jgi:hypothetical protein